MKKILIPLLCVTLLTGCSLNFHGEDEQKETEEQIQPSNNQPENTPTGETNQNGSTSNPETPSGNQPGEQTQTSNDSLTKTITFLNGGFTGSLNQTATQENFLAWINGNDNLFSSIEYKGFSQLNYIGNEKDPARYSTLQLGSANDTGEIKFNFAYDVLSVKFNVQAYTKSYTSNGTLNWSTDKQSKFYIDTDLHDLSVTSNGQTPKQDFIKTYNPAVKSFLIKSSGGRVFVHSMEVTYKKN